MGVNVSTRLQNDPDMMMAWESYQLCRTQQLIVYEKPTGRKDGSKVLTTILWPTGFSVLPNGGSLNDESYVITKYFHGFMSGEKKAAAEQMKKKGR